MTQLDEEICYLNALNHLSGLGAVTIRRLREKVGGARAVWDLPGPTLDRLNLPVPIRAAFNERPRYDPENLFRELAKNEIIALPLTAHNYPKLLKEIYDPPPLLYCRGNLKIIDTPALTVVGTRKPSPYGQEMGALFTRRIATAGITIVSGLAFGIDTVAHETTLAENGNTISVVASGLDWEVIYPRHNLRLAQTIAARGLLISERPPGRYPQKYNFPMRNRIASGVSRATLVVEAPLKSGALITARSAFNQNREVFAIPGDICRGSARGVNGLIAESIATLALAPEQIMESYNVGVEPVASAKELLAHLPAPELKIYQALLSGHLTVDELKANCGLDTNTLFSTITHMELKHLITRRGGSAYSIIAPLQ